MRARSRCGGGVRAGGGVGGAGRYSRARLPSKKRRGDIGEMSGWKSPKVGAEGAGMGREHSQSAEGAPRLENASSRLPIPAPPHPLSQSTLAASSAREAEAVCSLWGSMIALGCREEGDVVASAFVKRRKRIGGGAHAVRTVRRFALLQAKQVLVHAAEEAVHGLRHVVRIVDG